MKQFFKEFKDFASKGNVMDLAIGVIIGSAFGKIVSSLVNDLIMPIVSVLTGGLNFSDIKFVLVEATEAKAEVAIMAGNFIKNVVDFLIIAFSIFIMIRALAKLKRKEDAKAAIAAEPVAPVENELSILKDIKVLLEKK